MIHECKLNCMSMSPAKAETLGIEDKGKWLPFAFHIGMVNAVKLTTDDPSHPTYNCTTVYCDEGETFIIDTPYKTFAPLWKRYIKNTEEDGPDDITL